MSFIKSIYQYFFKRKIKTLNDVKSTLGIDINPKEYRKIIKIHESIWGDDEYHTMIIKGTQEEFLSAIKNINAYSPRDLYGLIDPTDDDFCFMFNVDSSGSVDKFIEDSYSFVNTEIYERHGVSPQGNEIFFDKTCDANFYSIIWMNENIIYYVSFYS